MRLCVLLCRTNTNVNDALGDYSLTLVDSLDTLVVRGEGGRGWGREKTYNRDHDPHVRAPRFKLSNILVGLLYIYNVIVCFFDTR